MVTQAGQAAFLKEPKDAVILKFPAGTRDRIRSSYKKSKAQPYQKVRVNRQILAICKIAG